MCNAVIQCETNIKGSMAEYKISAETGVDSKLPSEAQTEAKMWWWKMKTPTALARDREKLE